VRTFAVVFARGRFDLGQSAATSLLVMVGLGGVVGVLLTGRLAEQRSARTVFAARPVVAGAALLGGALAVLGLA